MNFEIFEKYSNEIIPLQEIAVYNYPLENFVLRDIVSIILILIFVCSFGLVLLKTADREDTNSKIRITVIWISSMVILGVATFLCLENKDKQSGIKDNYHVYTIQYSKDITLNTIEDFEKEFYIIDSNGSLKTIVTMEQKEAYLKLYNRNGNKEVLIR